MALINPRGFATKLSMQGRRQVERVPDGAV